MSLEILLQEATLNGVMTDIGIAGGRIVEIADYITTPAEKTISLEERAVLPGLIETHCHLDKTFTIDDVGNESGTLLEAIKNWVAYKSKINHFDYVYRANRAIEMAIAAGTASLRTHVDVDSSGFMALEAMLQVREKSSSNITMQIVALGCPELEMDIMREALRMGADAVGGCPAIRRNPRLEIEHALDLAEEFGKPVDLHIDENDHSNTLEMLADEVLRREFSLPVMAGHCCSLDFMNESAAARVIDKVAKAGISIVSLPACNLNLQGRGQHPMPRGVTRVSELIAAGVNVCFGSDNVQDPFHPVGNYDLLFAAQLGAIVTHLSHLDGLSRVFEMITTNAAKALSLESPEIAVGGRADLVVVNASSMLEALRILPVRPWVFHGTSAKSL